MILYFAGLEVVTLRTCITIQLPILAILLVITGEQVCVKPPLLLKAFCYQHFLLPELNITMRIVSLWPVVRNFAPDPKSTQYYDHQVALTYLPSHTLANLFKLPSRHGFHIENKVAL